MIRSTRHVRRLTWQTPKEPLEVPPRGALLKLVRHSHTSSQKCPLALFDGSELIQCGQPTIGANTPRQWGRQTRVGLRRQSLEHTRVRQGKPTLNISLTYSQHSLHGA